jgi:hypothetical protein
MHMPSAPAQIPTVAPNGTIGAAHSAAATSGSAFKTLEQYIIERQEEAAGSTGQFSRRYETSRWRRRSWTATCARPASWM